MDAALRNMVGARIVEWHRREGRMEHRHLEAPGYTLAAIDDVIARGSLDDWIELDAAAASDARVGDKIRTVVMARSDDESSINHDFWRARMATPRGEARR